MPHFPESGQTMPLFHLSLSMPHFPESGQTMPLFPLSDLSIQVCVARTLRRRSSWSLTRSLTGIGDDSGLCYFYMTRYYMNNLIFMF
ncbi:hypothetical protein Hanom_Chr01g00066441 [Helianthus anomalus]